MTPEEITERLLPCPFCGNIPTLQKDELIDSWFIECTQDCIATPFSLLPTEPRQELIRAWNTRAPKDNWIPISERLPEYGVEVLTAQLRPNGEMCREVSNINELYGWFVEDQSFGDETKVTHWQPLPQLPEIGEKR